VPDLPADLPLRDELEPRSAPAAAAVDRPSKFKLGWGKAVRLYMVVYGTGRFFIEGIRTDFSYYFGPLRTNQVTALLIALAGLAMFAVLAARAEARPRAVGGAPEAVGGPDHAGRGPPETADVCRGGLRRPRMFLSSARALRDTSRQWRIRGSSPGQLTWWGWSSRATTRDLSQPTPDVQPLVALLAQEADCNVDGTGVARPYCCESCASMRCGQEGASEQAAAATGPARIWNREDTDAMQRLTPPPRRGPVPIHAFEHDACGVAFVAT
jgi:hypothetical protein